MIGDVCFVLTKTVAKFDIYLFIYLFIASVLHWQWCNSFIRGHPVRFGRGPYLYIFIKSHMLINWKVNIVSFEKNVF